MTEKLHDRITLHAGDCLSVMDSLADNSIDACVCDPPYHLHSIVKRFAKTGRTESTKSKSGPHQRTATGFMGKQWDGGDIAFQTETWAKVFRLLKPGAYLIAFSSSRTFGRMSVAIEDAGFITHPMIGWLFATGFPKAHRVDAEGYEGFRYGAQSLKPALEPIYMGQKPFSEATGTANILKWGTGAINVDATRIDGSGNKTFDRIAGDRPRDQYRTGTAVPGSARETDLGRWPANICHDGSAEVLKAFPLSDGANSVVTGAEPSTSTRTIFNPYDNRSPSIVRGDSGSAARFFFSAKADADDRLGSKHPTVKPVDLMQWLCRLVCPPGATILDPFAGTGTTGEAAWREGFHAVLIEREAEYQADIRRRVKLMLAGPDERARESIKARGLTEDAGPLFAAE